MGEIIKNNKLIAEFMGVTIHDKWDSYLDATYYNKQITHVKHFVTAGTVLPTQEQLAVNKQIEATNAYRRVKYDTSWDALMPVVERIESLPGVKSVMILKNFCRIDWDPMNYTTKASHTSKIKTIYTCVVDFIKWYNQHPEQHGRATNFV